MEPSSYELIRCRRAIVRLAEMLHVVSPEIQAEADRVWKRASAANPLLFDNHILTCLGVERTDDVAQIRCAVTNYRFYYAQRSAGLELGVLPVAVSGALRVDGPDSAAWLLGQRGPGVTQYPFYMECVPSGGLEPADIGPGGIADHHTRLTLELRSETGLDAGMIDRIEDCAVITDRVDPVVNVLCLMNIRADFGNVRTALRSGPEYTSFRFLDERDVSAFLKGSAQIVPTTQAALKLLQRVKP